MDFQYGIYRSSCADNAAREFSALTVVVLICCSLSIPVRNPQCRETHESDFKISWCMIWKMFSAKYFAVRSGTLCALRTTTPLQRDCDCGLRVAGEWWLWDENCWRVVIVGWELQASGCGLRPRGEYCEWGNRSNKQQQAAVSENSEQNEWCELQLKGTGLWVEGCID